MSANERIFSAPMKLFNWPDLNGKTLRISVAWDGDQYLVAGRDEAGFIYVLAEGKRQ